MKLPFCLLASALCLAPALNAFAARVTLPLDQDWRFLREEASNAQATDFNDSKWEAVTLPHTARVESLVAGKNSPQWQGICWYRKMFTLAESARGKQVVLRFEGAMNAAEIWVNGVSAGKFMGGYLPYVMDISKLALPGKTNVVAVRLDNRDNPLTGPKPLADLDFNLYSGLYRGASLTVRDSLHITDPILANQPASGGVFVNCPEVSPESAKVSVATHVNNDSRARRQFIVRTRLFDDSGRPVTVVETPCTLAPASHTQVHQILQVARPALWSPHTPALYHLRSEILENGLIVDSEQTRIGIRRFEISKDGLRINGEKWFLRGANRHQEYPYIGNALSDAAQYRDAWKIKEAGFDFVRLAHYPQATAFLDACDELGIVVLNCIMGWQYFNPDPRFTQLKLRECRDLVRRDRNHPSVALWEVSLNESDMPREFIHRANAITHEEFPGDQCHTAGWQKGFDVFVQARQHGGCKAVKDQPCLVSEYGDWEYYAQNAGFEQHLWKDLKPAERSSRQSRGDGQTRLLQQATNFQEAHNDNLKTRAFADGIWVMFDYNRGYAADVETSGVMDLFRLPKYSYWFLRTQRSPHEKIAGTVVGPTVFIANDWTPESPLDVRVFSNCEEVALYLNGRFLERRRPDASRITTHLKHPPFTFKLETFEPGTLRAVGFIGNRQVTTVERPTPGNASELVLRFDTDHKPFATHAKDAVFCYAEIRDSSGVLVPSGAEVSFGIHGAARLVGQKNITAEAGIAAILVESDTASPECAVYALSVVSDAGTCRILSAAASPNGSRIRKHQVRYTLDGSQPALESAQYLQPIPAASTLKAALFVGDEMISLLETKDVPVRTTAAR